MINMGMTWVVKSNLMLLRMPKVSITLKPSLTRSTRHRACTRTDNTHRAPASAAAVLEAEADKRKKHPLSVFGITDFFSRPTARVIIDLPNPSGRGVRGAVATSRAASARSEHDVGSAERSRFRPRLQLKS